jgi:hypothetical protein
MRHGNRIYQRKVEILVTRRTQRRSRRWWWSLNHVLIHQFSIVRARKVELQSKQTKGG